MKSVVVSALSAVIGATVGASVVGKVVVEEKEKAKAMSDKHLALFLMMNQWVKVKQEGKNLAEYFKRNGYKKIAVYGMSYAGETLVDELRGSEIEIAYGIDRNTNGIYSDMNIFSIEDELGEVDVVIVTAITFFDEISERLSEKMRCPIFSLEDILYEV